MYYFVTDTIDGVLDSTCCFETEIEAKAFIRGLEAKDMGSGSYREGFYVIVEVDPDELDEDFFDDVFED